jgi:colicin import membrane protein
MSQMTVGMPPRRQPDDADFLRYGWRYVQQTLPNGKVEYDQVPLTLEDLLHPQYGDVLPHNSAHDEDRLYLFDVAKKQVAGDPTALVLCDVLVVWDVPGLRPHSPDLSVIFGVRRPEQPRKSFDVGAEGVRPRILIEVVSPNYRNNDVVIKVEHYHQARVPLYVIVDRQQEEGPVKLTGYRYAPQEYEEMPTDAQGRLWLEPLRVWLGARGNRVVCYDGVTGQELGDYTRVSQEAERLSQGLATAEERIRELEAEIRRLRGEPKTD